MSQMWVWKDRDKGLQGRSCGRVISFFRKHENFNIFCIHSSGRSFSCFEHFPKNKHKHFIEARYWKSETTGLFPGSNKAFLWFYFLFISRRCQRVRVGVGATLWYHMAQWMRMTPTLAWQSCSVFSSYPVSSPALYSPLLKVSSSLVSKWLSYCLWVIYDSPHHRSRPTTSSWRRGYSTLSPSGVSPYILTGLFDYCPGQVIPCHPMSSWLSLSHLGLVLTHGILTCKLFQAWSPMLLVQWVSVQLWALAVHPRCVCPLLSLGHCRHLYLYVFHSAIASYSPDGLEVFSYSIHIILCNSFSVPWEWEAESSATCQSCLSMHSMKCGEISNSLDAPIYVSHEEFGRHARLHIFGITKSNRALRNRLSCARTLCIEGKIVCGP
jgi:hypothetical protein